MLGLMQDHPLNIPMVVGHAERLHARKSVFTRTEHGVTETAVGQVLERARRLVAALKALGVRGGDRVATFAWNTQQHLEAYVGVPCLGAILHTLNIRLFEEDLAYIVEHAGDSVVIVDRSLLPIWQKVAARVRCVRTTIVVPDCAGATPPGHLDYEELLAAHAPERDLPEVPERQAAAMCYTSGTTGRPKGVVYSHRSNVLHSLVTMSKDALGVCERDVVLPIVPMFHANAWGLPYTCLLAGAELVLPGRHGTPQTLCECLVERGVTLAAGVPSIWIAMLDDLARVRPPTLERILCGGSAVPASLQRAYRERVGVEIHQAWGMTETSPLGTICKTLAKHEAQDPDARARVLNTQGRPVPLVELRLVGEDGGELPRDGVAVGELEARGPWIASAYHDDPTSDRFRDGWLRTGDVASICPDGYLRIADRTKDLVKSGGEWISSVELEGHLLAHPGVLEAAVVAIPHPKWAERPLACVVARPGATVAAAELLEFIRPRVAKWWLPDDVVFLEALPKTSVGKLDKKVLRERYKDHAQVATPRPS